jgi:hypothetical protein
MRELDEITDDSLARFIDRWYGPANTPAVVSTASIRLPSVLRGWHERLLERSVPLVRFNELVPLDDIDDEDGMAVFWVENQAVMVWGFPFGDEDPAVHERYNEEDATWRPVGLALSRFGVYAEVIDALLAPRYGALNLSASEPEVDAALVGLRRLEGPPWTVMNPGDDCRFYAGDDAMAAVMTGAEPGVSQLYVTVRDHDHLARFDDLSWHWHSDDD